MKKRIFCGILTLVLLLSCIIPANAASEVPYVTWTMGTEGVVETQTAYEPIRTMIRFGEETLKMPSDLRLGPDGNLYIGIGHWGYLAYEQHGEVRFTVDAQSAEVAKRNTTVLVLNTEYSLTELSSKVNGNISNKPQAFKLIKLVEGEPTTM